MRLAVVVSCGLALLCSIPDASAQITATEVGRLEVPAFQGSITNPFDVAGEYPHEPSLDGSLLYVPLGTFSDGLLIFDVANPASPRFVSQFSGIHSRDVAVQGGLLYSVDAVRLNIVDMADPASPSLRGTLELGSGLGISATSVAISGSVAYVTGGGPFLGDYPALTAVDVSNPAAPRVMGSSAEPGGADLFIDGATAYVTGYGAGLRIYDIANPAAPRLVGSTGTLGDAVRVRVVGTTAYVFNTGSSFSLASVDVTDRAHPVLIQSLPIPSELISLADYYSEAHFYGMEVAGGRAYLSGWHGAVVVDISTPAALEVLGTIGPDEFTGGVALREGLIVAVDRIGVVVLRLGADPLAVGGPDLDSDAALALNATASFDPDGVVTAYRWHLENRDTRGSSYDLEGAFVSLRNVSSGVYQARLRVEDDSGALSRPVEFPLAVPLGGGSADLAQGVQGLQEIQRLLRTPWGLRSSSSDYTGVLGDALDAIVRLLLSPPGRRLAFRSAAPSAGFRDRLIQMPQF